MVHHHQIACHELIQNHLVLFDLCMKKTIQIKSGMRNGIWVVFLAILKYALRDSTGEMWKHWRSMNTGSSQRYEKHWRSNFRLLHHIVKMFLKTMVSMWRGGSGNQCSRTFKRRQHIDVWRFPLTSISNMLYSNCILYFISEDGLH